MIYHLLHRTIPAPHLHFFDLGGIIVMHDASGCTGNYTGYDEPRWIGSKSAVFCSGLRRIDAVMGK
ncbi:MAG: hypothetical protein ACLR6H_07100 [Roseburia sp.]